MVTVSTRARVEDADGVDDAARVDDADGVDDAARVDDADGVDDAARVDDADGVGIIVGAESGVREADGDAAAVGATAQLP